MVGFTKNVLSYRDQNYQQLRKHHLELGTLFSDPIFPPVDSVFQSENVSGTVVWKRPRDICENPCLFSDSQKSKLVKGGELSCNWMVSACAVLAGVNELKNKVIPDYWEQDWDTKYCGIFHLRIWRFGVWLDVVVDDFFPTVDNKLVVMQAGEPNHFWPALLEKAYAKLHGSYTALGDKELGDALVDFTGGVSETLDLSSYLHMEERKSQLFDILRKESADHSIITFTLNVDNEDESGARNELGLIKGHTYLLTHIKKCHLGETTLKNIFNGSEKVAMIRLMDLREDDLTCPPSPDSALGGGGSCSAATTEAMVRLRSRMLEWSQVSESQKKRLGLSLRHSSEFWMPLEDVVWGFSDGLIIRLVLENPFSVPGQKWMGSSVRGRWESGPKSGLHDRSGGGDPTQSSFLSNPQYLMKIECGVEILLQLLQYQDVEEEGAGINSLIALHMIKVEENRSTRLHKIWEHTPIVVCVDHQRKREITYRGWIYPGNYIILPTTYRQGDTLSFILRLFTKKNSIKLSELTKERPKGYNPCSCLFSDYELVTVVIMDSAEITHPRLPKLNVYCSISCEGKRFRTPSSGDSENPQWNSSFIFYRKSPHKPVLVKVLSENKLFPDILLGQCELPAGITHTPTPLDAVLLHKFTKDSDPEPVGAIHLIILTEDNIIAV